MVELTRSDTTMDDLDFETEIGPTAEEAAALVSKWLDDSEDEENDEIGHSGAPSSSHSGTTAVSRVLGYVSALLGVCNAPWLD